jgi:AcrR family transcriptional regulator
MATRRAATRRTPHPTRVQTAERDVASLLPEGTEPPLDIAPQIFEAGLHTFLEQRRVDMRSLAVECGIGRATLYRRTGSRDHLLGHVLWYLTRRNLMRAGRKAAGLAGTERILAVVRHFLSYANEQPSLRRFLEAEPEAALRILTSRRGIVQPGVVSFLERLLQEEVDLGRFVPRLDERTLAFVIVRIGEGFLYADVIADGEPDVDQAVEVIKQLIER